MLKKLLFILLLSSFASAQSKYQKQIDSILRVVSTQKNDTAKAQLYNRVAECYSYARDTANAFKYAGKALSISEREKYKHGKMDAYFSYALAWSYGDKFEKQKEYHKKILALCTDKYDDTRKVRALKELGMNIAYNADLEKGVAYLKQAAALAQSINDNAQYIEVLMQTGAIYHQRGKLHEAAQCYQKAIAFNEKTGRVSLSEIIYLADIYNMQNNQAKALELFLKALGIADKNKISNNFISNVSNSVGDIYFDRKEYKKALEYYKKSEVHLKRFSLLTDNVDLYLRFSEVYDKLGDAKLSEEYFNKAVNQKANNPVGYGDYIAKQRLGQNRFKHLKYEDALTFHQQSLDVIKQMGMQSDIAKARGNIGACQVTIAKEKKIKGKIIEESIANLEAATDTLKAYKDVGNVYLFSKYLTEAYEYSGAPVKALEAYKQYMAYKDSMFETEKWNEFNLAQSQYEFDKKELLLKQNQKQALEEEQANRNYAFAGVGVLLLIAGGAGVAYNRKRKDNRTIAAEKKRSDDLLLNILPAEVAEELKATGEASAQYYDKVSIIFTDFVGFTKLSEKFSPEELIGELNYCFKAFDNIITKHHIEKIKTIGDSYMAVSGLPGKNTDHAKNAVEAALEMRNFIDNYKVERRAQGKVYFEMRTGINSGNVVAGIVGIKKFAYDVWGDAVNIASRMESSGAAGKINISESTYELVKEHYEAEYRGELDAKGKGLIKMYFVEPKHN